MEETPVGPNDMGWRISAVHQQRLPWLVCEGNQGRVIGFAYATPFRKRTGFRYTVETKVYLEPRITGRGVGALLYQQLIDQLNGTSYRAAMSCIGLPDDASVKLLEKIGFRQVGLLRSVGYKFDRWVDVSYWQLMLNQIAIDDGEISFRQQSP